jgi:carboxyl-terminal processing protease
MEVGMQEDQLQVIAPLEGTPAEAAGLRPGDHIVKIDETFTAELSIDESVALIRGTEGSIVTLTIFREGWTESKEFPITRAVITIPSLRWEEKEEGIAYVKIFQFTENLRSDFRQLENNIIGAGADKIIIDVRNNPGGYLHSAVDVSGWFLERGDTVVIEDYGTEQEQEVHKARGNGRFKNYSIVVLINGGSASASEILAGALRDNRGIVLVGEKSFGKGSVQELRDLKNNASLKVTIANWLTPQGVLITGEGLHPDIEVDFSDEDFEQGRDPQLDKAIEVLKNL